MKKRYSAITIGLIFIFIGLGLLLDRLGIFNFGWMQLYPLLFLLISIVFFVNAFTGHKNAAFWGGAFGVLGVFFVLRNYDFIPFYWFVEFWPIFLIALGVGFLVLYIFRPDDWGVLIPGIVLTFIGFLFLIRSMDVMRDIFYLTIDIIETYWPLILVLIGIGLIANSLRTKDVSSEDKTRVEE